MDVTADRIGVQVHLPLPLLDDITAEEEAEISLRLHDAVLPVAEWVFSRSWATHLAERMVADHDKPMPSSHDDL